jgi:hypothetical protein
MESLLLEQEKLDKKGNLSQTIEHVQKTIDLLVAARDAVAAGMHLPMLTYLTYLVPSFQQCNCYK